MPRTAHSRQRRNRMTVATADLALSDLGTERRDPAPCSNQLSDVVSLDPAHVVELKYADVLRRAVDATTFHRLECNAAQNGYSALARAPDVSFMTSFVVSIVLLLTIATITVKSVTVFR